MNVSVRAGARGVAAAVLAACCAGASAGLAGADERVPERQSDRQAAGSLSAQLVLVADDRRILGAWDGRQETLDVATVRAVAVGSQANAFVVFTGCTQASSGHCDVTMRFHVYRPDGKVFAVSPPMEVWQYKPAPPARALQPSAQYLKVVVEPHDALGRYVVSASVKDHVSGATLQLSTAFEATR